MVGAETKARAVGMVALAGASRADLAERLDVSDRYARKVIAALHAEGRIFVERWAMIERGKSGPMYVAIYRRRIDPHQVDAPRPPGSPRSVRDYALRKSKIMLALVE